MKKDNSFDKDKYNWNKDLKTNGGCGRILFFFGSILLVFQSFYHFWCGTLSMAQIQLTVLCIGFFLVLVRVGE
tara:strand:+ start:135 stop:353 length:219 start_codon:yes stop_codon:yes gene_type:complete